MNLDITKLLKQLQGYIPDCADALKIHKPNNQLQRDPYILGILKQIVKYFEDYKTGNSYLEWESNVFLIDGSWGSGKSWTIKIVLTLTESM